MNIESTDNTGDIAPAQRERSRPEDAIESDVQSEIDALMRYGLSPTERDAWSYVLRNESLARNRLLQIASCMKRHGIRPEECRNLRADYGAAFGRAFPGFPEDASSLETLAGDIRISTDRAGLAAEDRSLDATEELRAVLEQHLPPRATIAFQRIGQRGPHGLIIIIADDEPLSAEDVRARIDDVLAMRRLSAAVPIDVRKTTFD